MRFWTLVRIEPSGLLISCAMPAESMLIEDSFSAWNILCSSSVFALISSVTNTQPDASRAAARRAFCEAVPGLMNG